MKVYGEIPEVFSTEADKTRDEKEYFRMNNRVEKMNGRQDALKKGCCAERRNQTLAKSSGGNFYGFKK